MKKLTLLALAAVISTSIWAVPAKRVTKSITLADGTKIEAVLMGDENLHYWAGNNGKKYQHVNNQFQELTSEQFEARKTNAATRSSSMQKAVAQRKTQLQKRVNALTGKKKGLVILVNFSDVKMTHTQAEFNNQFNQEGYSLGSHLGSVKDYFKDQSYGQFELDFDVVGPYTISGTQAYYGGNDSSGDDKNPGAMAKEAIKKADADVNFADYVWYGNGEVDQVFIIFAGYTEAQGGSDDCIWAHEWNLRSATGSYLTLDGVKVNTYACSPELRGGSGTVMCPIGTACHEFSHCLGYPDFYDTDYNGGFGMDCWDVMSGGSYNGPIGYGEIPSGYTSWERWDAGWLEPTVLKSATSVNDMAAITDKPEAYIVYNDANPNEYYLLENRQQSSWDQSQYGHGMLVLHVDYSASAWSSNTPNDDPNHQRMNIIPADNQFMTGSSQGQKYATSSDLKGDPFPGSKKKTALTDDTTPAATLFNNNKDGRKFMGKPIENITEDAYGLISFSFMGGIEAPVATEATNLTKTSFTANWDANSAAKTYTVQLYKEEVVENTTLLEETYSKFPTSAGTSDISTKLNTYMDHTGWTGSKVFAGGTNKIKFDSSSATGYLLSPTINAPSTGTVTLVLKAYNYREDCTMTVTVDGTSKTQKLSSTETEYSFAFADVKDAFNIKIAFSARAYLSNGLQIIDGNAAGGGVKETVIQEVSGITENQYTFANLTDSVYLYKVKLIDGNSVESGWSNVIEVNLPQSSTTGDLNGDGKTNVSDLTFLVEMIVNNTALTEENKKADFNNDGVLNVSDLTILVNYIMTENPTPEE